MKTLDLSNIVAGTRRMLAIKDTFLHMEEAYMESLAAFIKGFGVSDSAYTKIYGLVNSGGGSTYTISAGAVYHAGEIFEVAAFSGTAGGADVPVLSLATTYRSNDPILYSDGASFNTHAIRKYTITFAASLSGLVDYSALTDLSAVISAYVTFAGAAGGVLGGNYPNPTLASGPFSVSGKQITNLANGTTGTDAVNFSQIPTSLAPTGPAGGFLGGNYPNPGLASGPINVLGKKIIGGAQGTTAGEYVTYEQIPAASLLAVTTVATTTYAISLADSGNRVNATSGNRRNFTLLLSATAGQSFRVIVKDASLVTSTAPLTIRLLGDDLFEDGTDTLTFVDDGTAVGFYTDGLGTWYVDSIYGTFTTSTTEEGQLGDLRQAADLEQTSQLEDLITDLSMQAWKTKSVPTENGAALTDDITIGASGGRIYLISFEGANAGSSVQISDGSTGATAFYTLVSSSVSLAANDNAVAASYIPSVMTEAVSGLKFYPVGANAIVRLNRSVSNPNTGIVVTYVDLP